MLPLLYAISSFLGVVLSAPIEYYNTKYEHINVEMILNNRRMVNYYSACLLNKGSCPPEGIELKRILPEALKTNCQRCTDKQKTYTLRAIRRLKKEYPKVWAELKDQWDPDGSYLRKFEESFTDQTFNKTPAPSVHLSNRYEDDLESPINPLPATKSPAITTTKITVPSQKTTTANPITSKIASTTTSSTPAFIPTEPFMPLSSIGAGIQATVSLGTNIIDLKSPINPSASTKLPAITTAKTTTSRKPTTTTKPITSNTRIDITTSRSNTPAFITYPPVESFRPLANIGAGIQATVSLGTNILENVVRGVGAIGSRIIEGGAQLADVVIKTLTPPVL